MDKSVHIPKLERFPTGEEIKAIMAGVKHDQGKPMMGLLPFDSLELVSQVLTYGAKKYAPDNWKKVPDAVSRYEDAMLRHISAYKKGEMLDPESGLPHLAHACCCLMFLISFTSGDLNAKEALSQE